MDSIDRIAFAVPLQPERVHDVEELARKVTDDPSIADLSRRSGLQRAMAWIQLDESPLLTVYMEWKVDPVSGLQGYERSQEQVARQIQTVLRQAASTPGDAALDAAASHSEVLFHWGCDDRSRGGEVGCYSRFVSREKAVAARSFLKDYEDPSMKRLYGRLRERVGMKCVTVWAGETNTSGEQLLMELYEADDLDYSFDQLARSAYELDEMSVLRTVLTFGWSPGTMPRLKRIWDWSLADNL